jgi:hypothetical protein
MRFEVAVLESNIDNLSTLCIDLVCDLFPRFRNYHPDTSVSVGDVSVMIEISELNICYLITSQSVLQ